MDVREAFQQAHHPLLPAELAANPGVHAGAIGAVLATISGALPAIAAVLPIIYYALLIADHLMDRFGKHPTRRRNRHGK